MNLTGRGSDEAEENRTHDHGGDLQCYPQGQTVARAEMNMHGGDFGLRFFF